MKRWVSLCVLSFAVAGPMRAADEASSALAAGVAAFQEGYQTWDTGRLAAAAAALGQCATNQPDSGPAWYWLGVAEFHRTLALRGDPDAPTVSPQATAANHAAAQALEQLLQLDPAHAEAHAMLGTLYGLRIRDNAWSGLRWGGRVNRHREQALRYGADNPRVCYLLGVCRLQTARRPADLREALAALQKAERLFAAEADRPVGRLQPRWGRASNLWFLGRTQEALGEREAAARSYRQALALQPANHLARARLVRLGVDAPTSP